MFAAGQHSRGAIVHPQPRLDETARQIFRAHGIEADTIIGPEAR